MELFRTLSTTTDNNEMQIPNQTDQTDWVGPTPGKIDFTMSLQTTQIKDEIECYVGLWQIDPVIDHQWKSNSENCRATRGAKHDASNHAVNVNI